jgi:ABC-type amino acid transport substrate-binding protein
MKFCRLATKALLAALSAMPLTALADDNASCATLVCATSGSTSPQGFQMRDGEPVDLVSGAKVVHGRLLVFSDGAVFRAYWQPDNSPKNTYWRMRA